MRSSARRCLAALSFVSRQRRSSASVRSAHSRLNSAHRTTILIDTNVPGGGRLRDEELHRVDL